MDSQAEQIESQAEQTANQSNQTVNHSEHAEGQSTHIGVGHIKVNTRPDLNAFAA
jgi:hypothetical protein